MSNVKKALFQACTAFVDERIGTIKQAMENAQAAANQETKSSAGDKYETGRAMMQLEKEKLSTQMSEALKMRQGLDQINADKACDQVALGAVVETAQASYFMSVSMGKITVEGKMYFAISPASPIGRQLLDKRAKDHFDFGGKKIQVLRVI